MLKPPRQDTALLRQFGVSGGLVKYMTARWAPLALALRLLTNFECCLCSGPHPMRFQPLAITLVTVLSSSPVCLRGVPQGPVWPDQSIRSGDCCCNRCPCLRAHRHGPLTLKEVGRAFRDRYRKKNVANRGKPRRFAAISGERGIPRQIAALRGIPTRLTHQ